MPNQLPHLPPQLAGYRLRRLLGQGAFGEVWEAEAPGGVDVAIKILHRALRSEVAQRELKALDVIKGLRHLHLLSLQAFYALDGHLFVVLELADGSLRQRLHVYRDAGLPGIPVEELLRYLAETAEALDFLHARKVLHRDIKPDNLLLVGGHVKVADYGLARLLDATSLHTASMLGTPLYMAPEVWQNKVNFTADQYALACTYAVLRTGRNPFPGDNQAAVMFAHLTSVPEVDVPEEERRVLLRALAKDAAERFPSCVAFVNALTAAVRETAVRQTVVRAAEQNGELNRPIAPSPSHLSRSLQSGDAAPRDGLSTAGPQLQETDPGFSETRPPARRRRPLRPLFVLGVVAFVAVGALMLRTWPPVAAFLSGTAGKRIVDVPKEQAEADERVEAGRAALDRDDFATALNDAGAALLLVPGHPEATALGTEATDRAAAAQTAAVAKLLRTGREALRDQRFNDAVRAADEALKILPADKEAIALRADAVAARAADALARKTALAAKLVDSGRAALEAQNIAAAMKAADEALEVLPGYADALALKADAKAAAALKKDRDDAADYVQRGMGDLAEKRYDGARVSTKAALKLVPDDKTATQLLAAADAGEKQDEAARLVARGRMALREMQFKEAQKAADDARALVPEYRDALALRRDAVGAEFIADGWAALKKGQFFTAEKAADDALEQLPGNADALALKADAKAAARQKDRDDAADYVQRGKDDLIGKRYGGARVAAKAALKLVPDDKTAIALLTAADAAELIDAGRADLKKGQFAAAEKAADDALELLPGNADALALKADAKAAARQKDRDDAADYVQRGKDDLIGKRYGGARVSAKAALKLVSDDKAATQLLADADTAEAAEFIAAGRTALKKGQSAVANKAADDALKLLPGDAAALALKKAASEPSPVGRWLGDQVSMGAQVKMDLRITAGGTWVNNLGAPSPVDKQEGTYELLGDKKISITFKGFDGKERTEKLEYTVTEDTFVMPNPNKTSEILTFKRSK